MNKHPANGTAPAGDAVREDGTGRPTVLADGGHPDSVEGEGSTGSEEQKADPDADTEREREAATGDAFAIPDTDADGLGEELVRTQEELDLKEFWAETDPSGEGGETVDLDEVAENFDTGGTPTAESIRNRILDDVRDYFEYEATSDFAAPPDEEFVRGRWFDFSYLEGAEEVERYWVDRPFAYVTVLYHTDEREFTYHVSEPTLDEFERYVRHDLVSTLRSSLMYEEIDDETDREAIFERKAQEAIAEGAATVEDGTIHKLRYFLLRDFLHYGPIDPIMGDGTIEDISCDGDEVSVYVYHQVYRDLPTNVRFSGQQLNSFVLRLAQRAGKHVSVSDPLVDASLPDGSRVQLTLGGDVASRGSNFTVRKFSEVPYTPVDLIGWNTFSADQMAYFWLAIENNMSLIFAGGTGSGKTTSMNAVSFFIPRHSKVVTIEDTREIDLPHENWIQSVTRSSVGAEARGEVSTYELLQAALRQRPEYLLVGEIRTEQRVALTFFQAMSTGHTAYTTVHADSVETVLNRLQNPPLSVPTQMVQDLDIVSIQRQAYVGDKRIRRNQFVAELGVGEDPNEVAINRLYRWDAREDDHEKVGHSVVMDEIADARGWSREELDEELADRSRLLQYLVDHEIDDYRQVAAVVQTYDKDPEAVLERVDAGDLDAAYVREEWQ